MTGFALIGLAMTVGAVLCVMLPLTARRGALQGPVDEAHTNLEVLRDQLAELKADLALGAISAEHYASAHADLERRVLEETAAVDRASAPAARPGRWAAPVVGALIPLAALAMYAFVGEPAGLRKEAVSTEEQVAPADVEQMVAGLAARLEKNPDDPRGWMMLGRSYYVMQRMPEAVAAYAKAAERIKDDADLYADYADAMAMNQGRRIEGKALDLVKESLRINPAQPKALAMAGTAAFYRKDFPAAIAYWEKLLPLLPPDSEMAKSVVGGIAEARELGAGKPATSETRAAPSGGRETAAKAPIERDKALPSVQGKVSLAAALAAKVSPTDTLFIVARAVNGPRIPLAVIRRTAADLPASFKLDDSQAMSPDLKLSAFPEVVVTARISKSGNAIAQPGDLQGTAGPLKLGAAGVAIVIDGVVP